MKKNPEWLSDSRRHMLAAVSERDAVKLDKVLADQRRQAAFLVPGLDLNAQQMLLASFAEAELLASLQRSHMLETLKNSQHRLAVLQTYNQNC